jgi:hypothetical protein
VPEVLTYKDKEGWSDWAMESLTRGLYNRWLKDKNPDLRWGMPRWLEHGLSEFVEELRVKGRKMEFRPDTWDSVELKNARRDGTLLTARDFFSRTSDEIWSDWRQSQQTSFFVQFLLVGSASRSSKYKNVLSDYLKNLIFILAEERDRLDAARKAAKEKGGAPEEKKPQTEEEEDAMFKARQGEWKKKEREALDKLIERTFSDWDDKDWEKFNALYMRDIK